MIERQPTVIIDEFFETPNQIREWALSLEYYKGDRGNWPGYRTDLLHEIDSQFHALICRKVIKHTKFNYFSQFDASFSLCSEDWESGWVHNDPLRFNVVGVIYLNPVVPPGQYGTIIYDPPSNYFNDGVPDEIFSSDVNEEDVKKRQTKERLEHNSHFTPSQIVENRYNRCIIFDARQWHSAGNFFGSSDKKEDQRLTIVFFGDAKL